MNYIAALFDLDGVLVDTESEYTSFWKSINDKYPTGVMNFEYVIKGSTLSSILNNYFPDTVQHEQILDELKIFEENMEYRLFEGVETLLVSLREAGVRTAIVTSSNKLKMSNLFKQLPRLLQLIDVVITEDDVTESKPSPQGYNRAAERLGVSPLNCVVFEDSLAGVRAGRNAGGAVVGVTTTNSFATIAPYCDLVLDRMSEFAWRDFFDR